MLNVKFVPKKAPMLCVKFSPKKPRPMLSVKFVPKTATSGGGWDTLLVVDAYLVWLKLFQGVFFFFCKL